MVLLSLVLFRVLLGNPVMNEFQFIGIACLGGLSLSLVFTLMSAIAAKAHQNAAIMAILGFPLIIPQLLLLIRLSKAAYGEVFREGAIITDFSFINRAGFTGDCIIVVLFPFLWKD